MNTTTTTTRENTNRVNNAANLADIIREAKKQESRTISGYNYGPIKYLRDRVLYADNGKTTAENMKEYEKNLQAVTDPETYAVYLLSSYDVFIDTDQILCDMRRAFPAVPFRTVCQYVRDHAGDCQQINPVSLALVPDCVLLQSEDKDTREKFRERHEKFYRLSAYWKGEEVNTQREDDLRRHFDPESLALHFILSEELYYYWGDDRAARALDNVREIYPEMTADKLREIYERYREPISDIYD